MSQLKIDDIVNVVVSTSSVPTPRDGFNVGLIIGKSTHIAAATRYKIYTGVDEMINDSFATTDPEYLAAVKYFAQTPRPQKVVVATCGASESWLAAITDCKNRCNDWYAVYIASATALTYADIQAVAAYIESIKGVYFLEHNAVKATSDDDTDIFAKLHEQSYRRTFALYSQTKYAGAAAMGFAMGANDGTAGSAYTMAYKSLAGVTPDDLAESDITNLRDKCANYYVQRGSSYQVLETGVCADGTWFDEVIGLDQLANDIQLACMDVLTNTRTKVPYTDAGALQFVLACNEACEDALTRGFLAPGLWEGNTILDLETGDTLESGFMCQAEAVADQSSSQRAQRICPPIYVCIRLAGAIHSVTIKVFVE